MSRRTPREPAEVGQVLPSALKKIGLTDQARWLQLLARWSEIVGPNIAARTQPHRFSRGVLVVKTYHAAWANELTFLKADILAKVNAALGGKQIARDLRVVGGSKPRRKQPPKPIPWAQREAHHARSTDAASNIADPELREAFQRMMEKALDREAVLQDPDSARS